MWRGLGRPLRNDGHGGLGEVGLISGAGAAVQGLPAMPVLRH